MKKFKQLFHIIYSYLLLYVTGWHTLYFIPPNKKVKVKDVKNNVAFAFPTYYPFEIKKLEGDDAKPWGWRGTPTLYGNGIQKWDGGWLIECVGIDNNPIEIITKWKNI